MTRVEQLSYDVINAHYLDDVSDQLLELGRIAGYEREVSELLEIDDIEFRNFVLLKFQNTLRGWLHDKR